MKNTWFSLCFLFLFQISFSQTFTLQPGPVEGNDALIFDDDPSSNFGTSEEFIAFYWTRSGHNYEGRSLLKFDLSSLPTGKTLLNAKLSLYWDQLASAGQAGDNDARLSRVTSAWGENNVTWNNKPSTSSTDFIVLPKSTSAQQDYIDIDVTSMVSMMYSNQATNYGFLIEQVVKGIYRSMKFGSSDDTNPAKRPKLVLTFESPCINQVWLRPGPSNGIDAVLKQNDPNNPWGNDEEFITYYWTFGGNEAMGVSLIKFDLSSIPISAAITSTKLSLFYNPTSSSAGQYGDNVSYLKRVTSSWNPATVTWNTMPTTSETGRITLNSSTSGTQNYLDIDVLDFTTAMFTNPGSNNGLMIKLVNQGLCRSMKFCSSNYIDSSMRPLLKICYSIKDGIASNKESFPLVYPNPASSYINIIGKNCSPYKLINAVVGVVQYGDILGDRIDISKLAKGVYFLVLEEGIQKVIIN
jgi:hypothetical protein